MVAPDGYDDDGDDGEEDDEEDDDDHEDATVKLAPCGDKNHEDYHDGDNGYYEYDGDEHEDVSHDNLVVVWALSAGHCLKFPSFSSLMEFFCC